MLLFLPSYLAFLILRTVFILLGWVLIPPMAIFWKQTTRIELSSVNGRYIRNWKYDFMYPWSNNEDGIVAGDELVGYPDWIRIIYWSAVRNPANNLRFVKYLTCKIVPDKVQFKLSKVKDINGNVVTNPTLRDYDRDDLTFTTLIWQGIYSNLRIQFKMNGKIWRFWIGFKIYAHDKLGISTADYRYNGAGFATQFKRIYPRNK